MYKSCHFILQYLNFFFKKPIYYIGFYKSKKPEESRIEIKTVNEDVKINIIKDDCKKGLFEGRIINMKEKKIKIKLKILMRKR